MVGFVWSTVLVYHATFCINSLAHVHGRKRYVTGDDSRNNWLLAFFTMGEGWHNNHHAYPSSVAPGLSLVGNRRHLLHPEGAFLAALVWDLKTPPEEVLRNEQRLGSRVINRAADQLAAWFNPERIALAVSSALHWSELFALQETLSQARSQRPTCWRPSIAHMPPATNSWRRRKRCSQAPVAGRIVDRAYELLLGAVGSRLIAASA